MKADNFCYWLQGYLELNNADGSVAQTLSPKQVAMIQRHLNMVFLHDIDPRTEPDPKKASGLQKLHDAIQPPPYPTPFVDPNIQYRC